MISSRLKENVFKSLSPLIFLPGLQKAKYPTEVEISHKQ